MNHDGPGAIHRATTLGTSTLLLGTQRINELGHLEIGGCDAVALACTEIPLLIGEADSPLPILDSTRILARAALLQATA